MALVDQELKAMGALTMQEHSNKRILERHEKYRKAAAAGKCPDCGMLSEQCDCLPF